jgi:hypothetical protein
LSSPPIIGLQAQRQIEIADRPIILLLDGLEAAMN